MMLTITIDLVPGGFRPLRRTIATMRIAHTTDLADVSDYRIGQAEYELGNRFAPRLIGAAFVHEAQHDLDSN